MKDYGLDPTGVVFCAPGQDLDGAPDVVVPTDHLPDQIADQTSLIGNAPSSGNPHSYYLGADQQQVSRAAGVLSWEMWRDMTAPQWHQFCAPVLSCADSHRPLS